MKRKYTSLPYTEYPVADGHFDTVAPVVSMIVLHSSASTEQGLINTFGGGSRLVCAHYGINNAGGILAFLEEYYTAYHAGNPETNYKSIGIEHVDEGSTKKIHSDAQYETSIKLVADICTFYKIPIDEAHIVPHSAVNATACPNGLDVARIINGAKLLVTPKPSMDYQQMYKDEKKAHDLDNKNKDKEIEAQRVEITKLNKQIGTLQARVDNLPAEIQVECQKVKDELTSHLLADFTVKEEGYKKQIEDLKKNGNVTELKIETPLNERFKGKSFWEKLSACGEIFSTK